jgi:HAD superfamily hydrolase (TIGR01662 family)
MFELIILDVDGTLAETYTLDLLPGVKPFFRLFHRSECHHQPKLAIASNQGGVGMRYMLERKAKKGFDEYPTVQDIEARLAEIARMIGGGKPIPVYASFRYQDKEENWTPVPPDAIDDPRWKASWRKPNPGMLQQAMQDAGVTPQQTLFVGDSPEDQQAAQAAGCIFEWAEDFFNNKEWLDCRKLADI